MTVPTTISELELNRSHMYSNYLEAYNQKMYPLSAIPIPEHLFGLQTAEQQGKVFNEKERKENNLT